MLYIEKNGFKVGFDENTGAASFEKGGVFFKQEASKAKITDAKADGDKIIFIAETDGIRLNCTYDIRNDETGEYACIELSGDNNAEWIGKAAYPPAIDVEKGYKQIDAYCEGTIFNVEDELPFNYGERPLFAGAFSSMAMWAVVNKKSWIMGAVITNHDSYLFTERGEDGLARTHMLWQDTKSKWGYTRQLRFYLGSGNPVCDIGLRYRKVAEQKGYVYPLKDRVKVKGKIEKLAGSASIWLWNNDAMHKLYDADAKNTPPTEEMYKLRRDVADDMKANGMDHVLWCVFDEHIDKKTVEYIQSLGYLTTTYNIYTDVIDKKFWDIIPETRRNRCKERMKYMPDGILVQRDGELYAAWELKGTDGKMHEQKRMCDVCAREYVREHIKKVNLDAGMDGVYIDVALNDTLECYSEEHPQTRTSGIETKNEMLEELHDAGFILGVENGHEVAVRHYEYNEGIISPNHFRPYDAGRRMATVYGEDEIPEKMVEYMLNPKVRIPLWELVYHDCQTTYWSWGDSTNSVPSLAGIRDLFDILYGQPPLYSLSVENWEKLKPIIIKSYKATVDHARKLKYAKMTYFEYLTEDLTVHRTLFDNGCEVVVNFSDTEFDYNGKKILPKDALIEYKEEN